MIRSNYRQEVADRLREIADKHGGIVALAGILGIPQPRMSQYVTGRMLPGNKMRSRFREKLGEDVEFFIMYGEHQEIGKRFRKNILVQLEEWHPEKSQMLKSLELHGITTAEQLNLILAARQQMILNEPQATYKPKRKKK